MSEDVTAQKAKNVVTMEEAGPCRKKIIVEIPEETIKAALSEQFSELQREAVLPGFRSADPLPRLPRRRPWAG